ncbi:MAG TPA: STAS domain-containing protein [Acidobacteriaceae bacterium]|nr:STAS domain-containing protein [Acidobacteriaceae bacterium]
MPVLFDRGTEPPVIRLEGEVDISQAAELKRVLLEALQAKGGMAIAMETATSMDVTAVQLLWAAEREARRAGVSLALRGAVPEALCATAREAGLERFPLSGEAGASAEVRA